MTFKAVCYFFLSGLCLISANATATGPSQAVFAGGCFWCMEADFEKLPGVTDVVSGFTGGKVENPTYHGNHDGHYEAIEVTYDPTQISYPELLEHFWVNIDPFDGGGQFCDRGPSYRSAIFVANQEERDSAETSRQRVVQQFPNMNVVTPILDASIFYPVKGDESDHQDYYQKNPLRYPFYRLNCGRDKRLAEIWGSHEKRGAE